MQFIEEGRKQVLACMSSLCTTKEDKLLYEIAPCQRMPKTDIGDCGVLAIAFATAIANGVDPSNCQFESREIRKHLMNCFIAKEITLFPSTERRCTSRIQKRSVDVFCVCRRTNFLASKDWELIECSKCFEWFHRMCVTNFPENPKKVIWLCEICE